MLCSSTRAILRSKCFQNVGILGIYLRRLITDITYSYYYRSVTVVAPTWFNFVNAGYYPYAKNDP
jgi:hypothetical protein